MHTNQIKPVHAVRTHPALRHGALFGWADSEKNFEKLDKHMLSFWMNYYTKCYEWSCCKFRHFTINKWTGAVSGRIHARTWNAAEYPRRTGTPQLWAHTVAPTNFLHLAGIPFFIEKCMTRSLVWAMRVECRKLVEATVRAQITDVHIFLTTYSTPRQTWTPPSVTLEIWKLVKGMWDILVTLNYDVDESPDLVFHFSWFLILFQILAVWFSQLASASMWVRITNVVSFWVRNGKFLLDWRRQGRSTLNLKICFSSIFGLTKSNRNTCTFCVFWLSVILLPLWHLFWWTIGRGKAVGEDVMRERRKQIGNKKRQKKLYETVYMHQVLRASNQLMFH